jgi:hypothetical protein
LYPAVGSVSAPAYSASGDTNTGIFFPAADTIAFAEGGAEAMRIDSSGNVGIGTDSPSGKLQVDGASYFYGDGAAPVRWGNTSTLGTLTYSGSDPIIQTNTGNLLFWQGTTERMRITSDGYLRMASGSLGIQFNGDTAAANALDDYEEGTFTPTIVGSTSAGTGTYSSQIGRYTKVGNLVTVAITLVWSAHTGTGNMSLTGLPFTSVASYNPISACFVSNMTVTGQVFSAVAAGGTTATIYSLNNGTSALLAIDTAASMFFTFSYYA